MEPTKIPKTENLQRLQTIIDQNVRARQLGVVDCIDCRQTVSVSGDGYRCLYCEAWFCSSCAERHFGKTRQQFYLELIKDSRLLSKHG